MKHHTTNRSLKARLAPALLAAALALGATTAAHASPVRVTYNKPVSGPEAKLPGFGGLFLENGVLHVYMLEPVSAEQIRPILAEFYGPEITLSGEIRLLQGQYAMSQLTAWQQAVGSIPGVVAYGPSDRHNRLSIGLESEEARTGALAALKRLGIPEEAVLFEVMGKIQLLPALMDGGPRDLAPGALTTDTRPAPADSSAQLRTIAPRTTLEDRLPGFGGLYLEGDVLYVYLLEPVEAEVIEKAVLEVYGQIIPAGGIEVLQGQYAMSQLTAWQQAAGSMPGLVAWGPSDRHNRLSLGFKDDASMAAATAELDRLGIPAEAVMLEVTGEIRLLGATAVEADQAVTTTAAPPAGMMAKLAAFFARIFSFLK